MSKSYDKLHSVKISEGNMKAIRQYRAYCPAPPSVPVIVNCAVEEWLSKQPWAIETKPIKWKDTGKKQLLSVERFKD